MNSVTALTIDAEFTADVIEIARRAGQLILDIYHAPEHTGITSKSDGSPVTAADLAAHNYIVSKLTAFLPLPIISEEMAAPDFSSRCLWQQYWLIDPLDGTKEFIARNGEFTVNIALVQQRVPVLGVVYVPVTGETYGH